MYLYFHNIISLRKRTKQVATHQASENHGKTCVQFTGNARMYFVSYTLGNIDLFLIAHGSSRDVNNKLYPSTHTWQFKDRISPLRW